MDRMLITYNTDNSEFDNLKFSFDFTTRDKWSDDMSEYVESTVPK